LADQAILVTEYRNIGGHDDDREVQADDVPLIQGFVDSLLEYLYWEPAKYERAAAAFEERKGEPGRFRDVWRLASRGSGSGVAVQPASADTGAALRRVVAVCVCGVWPELDLSSRTSRYSRPALSRPLVPS
jgi:hypothetical protein